MKQTLIKEYIRDNNNNPRGVAVAVRDNDQVFYGYSLCNKKDRYDKTRGMNIAVNRALAVNGYNLPLIAETRKTILERFASLEKRALKYFADISPDNVVMDFSCQDQETLDLELKDIRNDLLP